MVDIPFEVCVWYARQKHDNWMAEWVSGRGGFSAPLAQILV